MSKEKEVEFSLKVFINKEQTKVLFAEANNDFADVLLSFLTLPLGKIIQILEKHYGDNVPPIGSVTSLLKGLRNPAMVNLWKSHGNEVLRNTGAYNSNHVHLKVTLDDNYPTIYTFGKPYGGLYTQNPASFIVSDDLLLVPNATGSIMQTLSKLEIDITDMQGAEMRNVAFGLKEIIHLLKGSLTSSTPLSDLVLDQRQAKFASLKSEVGISLDHIYSSTPRDMVLKMMFQKSTKKLLFAQAEEDFVDFLFSLLIIPLGMVEWLLKSSTGLMNIDNLYRSITDNIHDNYLRDTEFKYSLMKPQVSRMYCLNCYLPLGEASLPRYFYENEGPVFVEGSRTFMVTDDLTVTRLCMSSGLSALNEMKISLADVEEVELHIGLEEALSVVKASLTSACALTDGLINPKLKKQTKQEH